MTEIREVPASGPGALSGFAVTCPIRSCGMELRSSLRTALELDLAAHVEWHARRLNAELAEIVALAKIREQRDPHRLLAEREIVDGRGFVRCGCDREFAGDTLQRARSGWRAHRRGTIAMREIELARRELDRELVGYGHEQLGSDFRSQFCADCLELCVPAITVSFRFRTGPTDRKRFHYCSRHVVEGLRAAALHRENALLTEVRVHENTPGAIPDGLEDPCPRCGGAHDRIDRREPCPVLEGSERQ